jgi:hypothetical protein
MTTNFSIGEMAGPTATVTSSSAITIDPALTLNSGSWTRFGEVYTLMMDLDLDAGMVAGDTFDVGSIPDPPPKTLYGRIDPLVAPFDISVVLTVKTTGAIEGQIVGGASSSVAGQQFAGTVSGVVY